MRLSSHPDLRLGKHCFIGNHVVIFERKGGGYIQLDDRVQINREYNFGNWDWEAIFVLASMRVFILLVIFTPTLRLS